MISARHMIMALLTIGAWAVSNPFAYAGWGGFYTSTRKETTVAPAPVSGVQNICIREILQAQTQYDIPDNILLGIGLQEAGTLQAGQLVVWPWAVNAEGRGYLFDTKKGAMNWVQEQLNNGMESIDVGCMQVNLRWHPDAFSDLPDAFTPSENVDYAARLLISHYNETGDWRTAAGRYHSKTPEKQQIYLTSLDRNIRVANAQIARFTALAGLKSPGVTLISQNQDSPLPETAKRGFWTSALSRQGDGTGQSFSLYSNVNLQPILPQLQRVRPQETE